MMDLSLEHAHDGFSVRLFHLGPYHGQILLHMLFAAGSDERNHAFLHQGGEKELFRCEFVFLR